MAGREYNYTRGNNAYAPNKRPYEEERRSTKPKVSPKRKAKTYKISKTKGIVGIFWMILILGAVTIFSYVSLFGVQKTVVDTKSEIATLEAENEALKVDLLKYHSIHTIESLANEKTMFLPGKTDTVDVEWSKDYFQNIEE